MKKKLFLVLTALFICCTFMIGYVNAKDTVDARVPEAIPENSDVLQAILDKPFDFSKIKFTSTGETEITGKTDIKKILLTVTPGEESDIKGEAWFAVYCLDSSLKYPQFSFVNFGDMSTLPETQQVQTYIMFALFNNAALTEKLSAVTGHVIEPMIEYTLPEGETDASIITKINANQEVEIKVQKLTYVGTPNLEITAADLSGNASDTDFEVTIKRENLLLDKYTANPLRTKNYNQAMWIIEHSYPTLDLEHSLSYAGADYYATIAELLVLTGNNNSKTASVLTNELKTTAACTDKEAIAGYYGVETSSVDDAFCKSKIDAAVESSRIEDYVYSTVQYAIWKANDGLDYNGEQLGNTLIGSDQLNILYGFLIRDREEYKNYLSQTYKDTVELVKPAAGSEVKEEGEYYIYGPYSVKHDLFSISSITLEFGKTIEGATIINKSGEEVDSIGINEQFYIKCAKDAKVTEANVVIKSTNATTFYPSTNRGRIYYAYYPNTQNVVSGGKLVNHEFEKNFDLVFNPKTGIEDVGVVFFAVIIAFSLGYVALAYKNKPVELE